MPTEPQMIHPTEPVYSISVLLFQNVPIFCSFSDLFHPSTAFCHGLKLEALRKGDSQNSVGQGPEQLAVADPAWSRAVDLETSRGLLQSQ